MPWLLNKPARAAALLAGLTAAGFGGVAAAPDLLPLVGGPGGTSFAHVCPAGHVLTGVRVRRGITLDAIGIRCRPVQTNGSLGAEVDAGPVWGGPGGAQGAMSCGTGSVIADQVARFNGVHLSDLRYHCYRWDAGTRRWDIRDKRIAIVVLPTAAVAGSPLTNGTATACPFPARPADGVRGRSGMIVDAVGIRCDAP